MKPCPVRFYFGVLFVFLVSLLTACSQSTDLDSSYISDTSELFSQNDIRFFVQAAQCLSIKAPTNEKRKMVESLVAIARHPRADVDDPSRFLDFLDSLDGMVDKENERIITALHKYCPYTSDAIGGMFELAGSKKRGPMASVLETIIKTVLAEQILDNKTRERLYINLHSAIGVDDLLF